MTAPVRHCVAAVLFASLGGAQTTLALDQLVQFYSADQQFMGSVLVTRGETILLNKGYGSANLEWGLPNTPTTKFRIGSITKQFTAAAILLLEERGKLSLRDPLSKYIGDSPPSWANIQIQHLLTHTAGIPDIEELPDYGSWKSFASPVERTVARFYSLPLEFQPGERFKYSSTGYIVLGNLIEKITGETYERFLQENIFSALGMRDSGYDSPTAIIPQRASGYGSYCSPADCPIETPTGEDPWVIKQPKNAGFIHMSIPHAAGSLYSTSQDLVKWQRGLFGGKLLASHSLEQLITPYKGDYGLGVFVRSVRGEKVIDHTGGIEGFSAYLAYFPEDKLIVTVLANLGDAGLIAQQLVRLVRGDTIVLPSERKEVAVRPAILSEFHGVYSVDENPEIRYTVSLDGNKLMILLPSKAKLPLSAESEKRFFLRHRDFQLEFARAGAKTVRLTIWSHGRELRCTRK